MSPKGSPRPSEPPGGAALKPGDGVIVQGKRGTVVAVVDEWIKVAFESGRVRHASVHISLLEALPGRRVG